MLQIGRSLVRTQLVSLEFFIDIKSFRSHYGPGVDSASNRNEYQEYFLGVKSGRCVRLTTLPPTWVVVMKSGNLNFLEPFRLLQACNGTDLPLPLLGILNVSSPHHFLFRSAIFICKIGNKLQIPFCISLNVQHCWISYTTFFCQLSPHPRSPFFSLLKMFALSFIAKPTSFHLGAFITPEISEKCSYIQLARLHGTILNTHSSPLNDYTTPVQTEW